MKKILITLLFIFSICIFTNIATLSSREIENVNGETVDNVELTEFAKSAILIEVSTNKVLYQKNIHKRMYPASMTKIMTLILIMEALESKVLTLDMMVVTSKAASKQIGSKIFLSENEQMSVNDLLKGICIASGNDAAYALAEKIHGSEKVFVKMMNQKKDEMGLKNTNFVNVSGVSDKGHYSSAYDIGMMSTYLLENYPEILEYTKVYEDYLRKESSKPFWLVNTNKLVKTHPEVDGLKTGWTEEALYCLSATMKRGDLRFVSVVMGCPDPEKRTSDTLGLLEHGFSNYEKKKILEKDFIVKTDYNIKYNPKKIELKLKTDVYILKLRKEDLKEYRYEIKINQDYLEDIKNIGVIELYYNNKLYSTHELKMDEELKKNNFFEIFKNIIIEFIN